MTQEQKVRELLEANEKQKIDKELKLAEQAKTEKDEFDKIIQKQLKDRESEKKKEEDRNQMRYDHNNELR